MAPLLASRRRSLYLYAHTQIDAQASYNIVRQIQIVVALLNLNNEVFGFYQGSAQFPAARSVNQTKRHAYE